MEKIAAVLEKIGLPFAYDHFAEGESPDPPFICYLIPNSDNFSADGRVYYKINEIHIELYTDCKDLSAEQTVEAVSMACFMRKPRYGLSRRVFTKSCTHLKWR